MSHRFHISKSFPLARNQVLLHLHFLRHQKIITDKSISTHWTTQCLVLNQASNNLATKCNLKWSLYLLMLQITKIILSSLKLCSFLGNDIDNRLLQIQLETFSVHLKTSISYSVADINTIKDFFFHHPKKRYCHK